MTFQIEKQNGIYYVDVYYTDTLKNNESCSYGTAIFDTKRNMYYLLPNEDNKYADTFVECMENLFVSKLAPTDDYGCAKINKDSITGDLMRGCEDNLIELFEKYSMPMDEAKPSKSDDDVKYYHLLHEYNRGRYSETKMYDIR